MPRTTIDRLIVNSPYEEPTKHWRYDRTTRTFDLAEGRRPAGYVVASEDSRSFDDPGVFVEIPLVNAIRARVKAWCEAGHPGVSAVTRRLLRHWHDRNESDKRLFFCQLEAAETLIWLAEASNAEKVGVAVPSDGGAFERVCAKMATGSGKTVVMAMVIAWQVLNKVAQPQDKRFAKNVLVVAPGLTVKSRLAVLQPAAPSNYYTEFNIVPSAMLDKLRQGRVLVHNWHALNWETDERLSRRRSVDKRGAKSDEAYVRDVLGEMARARDILVLNDEAHHAWRVEARTTRPRGVAKDEVETATKWIGGLDRIHRTRGVLRCYDFSATPFAPTGSTSSAEALFDWIVSDFGLNDAIEAGLVKTPRVVVRDDAVPDAKTYKSRLYHIYNDAEVKDDLNRKASVTEPLPDLVRNGYYLLGYDWRETAKNWQAAGIDTRPTMITVANRTETAARVKHAFDNHDILIDELCEPQRTLHIDSKVLTEAEAAVDVGTDATTASAKDGKPNNAKERAEFLRRQVDTVGQPGEPGELIQNVISVGMLSEGWDTKTVTHIMGLRAFASQLLCEQVVGRGLRRTAYDVSPETGLFEPEYVNVFGVPFTFLPHEAPDEDVVPPPAKPKTAIEADKAKAEFEIRWPNLVRVDRVFQPRLSLDLETLEPLVLDASRTAKLAEVAPIVEGKPDVTKVETIDLKRLAREYRLQRIVFETAAAVFDDMREDWTGCREVLLVQLVGLTERFLRSDRIIIEPQLFGADDLKRRLLLTLNMTKVVRHLWQAIRFENTEKLVPVFDRDQPIRSTGDMVTWYTGKPCDRTQHSHINQCVHDSTWEATEAYALDHSDLVDAWVKNDHLGFDVFYVHAGVVRKYRPDFLIRLTNGTTLVLEVKGREREEDRTKRRYLEDWCNAVTEHGGFGHWYGDVSKHPGDIHDILKAKAQPRKHQRIGFMAGEIEVPEDFDTMGEEDIREMFEQGS